MRRYLPILLTCGGLAACGTPEAETRPPEIAPEVESVAEVEPPVVEVVEEDAPAPDPFPGGVPHMSDEEREESMGRMRDRFEDWRASGEVELPELTLD